MKIRRMRKEHVAGLVVVLVFVGIVAYFFVSLDMVGKAYEVPPYVTGELRELYEWARTPEGKATLEQLPCYCGCKYEGHLHTRHCFWRDDGSFDKHGVTCSVCFDIARTAKQMLAEGKDICEIRAAVDSFYAAQAELATPTPMPSC